MRWNLKEAVGKNQTASERKRIKIMAVADIFSALTEDRPYRKRMDKEKVADILRGDAEKRLISSGVVDLLMSNYNEINKLRASESRVASRKYQESLKQAETG